MNNFLIFCRKIQKNAFIQYISSIFLGGLAFVVDFSILWLFTSFFHLHYLTGATAGMIAGFFVSFTGSKHIIFRSNNKNKYLEFFLFLLIFITGLILNNILMYVLIEKYYYKILISKVFATIIVSIWNFIFRKWVVFKDKRILCQEE